MLELATDTGGWLAAVIADLLHSVWSVLSWGGGHAEVIAGVITATATVGGLFFVGQQLRAVARQTQLQYGTMRSELYRGASDGNHRILRVFMEYPWLRPYFYDGKEKEDAKADASRLGDDESGYDGSGELPPTPELFKALTQATCEMFADFADDLIEQSKSVSDMDWATWWVYLRFLYQNSPALREFLEENLPFYPDYLHEYFGHLVVRDQTQRTFVSRWSCYEVAFDDIDTDRAALVDRLLSREDAAVAHLRPGRRRYPWFQHWYILREEVGEGIVVTSEDEEPAATDAETDAEDVIAAIVTPTDEDPTVVRVTLGTNATVDVREVEAVRSWILHMLNRSGSSTVEFYGPSGIEGVQDTTYDLRIVNEHHADTPSTLHGNPTYEAPRYRPYTERPRQSVPVRIASSAGMRGRSSWGWFRGEDPHVARTRRR